jgi:hypothetical protein
MNTETTSQTEYNKQIEALGEMLNGKEFTSKTITEDHGRQQAEAQAAHISALVAALNCDYSRLQDLRDEREELAEAVKEAEKEGTLTDDAQILAEWDEENAEGLNTLEHEAGDCADQDEARQRIQEDPLSVEVRGGWDVVGGDTSPAEFRIVLCTGGPHVEIRGDLDGYGIPHRAWLQYQDWGTPMSQFFMVEQSTLLEYCQEFYFGE